MPQRKQTEIGYFSGATSGNNIISYLEEHRRTIPDRTALRWIEAANRSAETFSAHFQYREISYARLAEDIGRVARGLTGIGVRPGDRAVVFLPIGVDLYTAMFAVQRLGAIAVFLDSWARRSHLGACAERAAPSAIISFDAALTLVAGMPEFNQVKIRVASDSTAHAITTLSELRAGKDEAPIHPVTSETTALITFTTGSSGVPKGANRTHRFLSAQHLALSEVIPYDAADIDLPAFPIFSLNNIASGVTTVIPAIDLAAPTERDGMLLARQILEGNISCATLSPSMFNSVSRYCAEHGVALNMLRRAVTGGAPISKDNVRDFMAIAPNATPLVLYGSTEAEPMAHITGQEMLAASGGGSDHSGEGVNVGRLHRAIQSKFIRLSKKPVEFTGWEDLEVPGGEIGELLVAGDHVCRDYYNDPDAFKRAKIVDRDGTVWHRTGDLGRLDRDGNLWIAGRVHNAILRKGKYYFPVRAEILLKQITGVKQAAYAGLPAPEGDERAIAAVSLDEQAQQEAAVHQVRQVLGDNGLPVDSIYLLPALPLDPRHHSKIEYEVLREVILREKPKDWI